MPHVLIVDQDPTHTAVFEAALAEHGVGSEVMTDGALALQRVRTGAFDALVVSVDLKGFSGYSVCNKLKKDPQLARVPLLLVSADASEETFAQHSRLKTRAEGYLRKPFDPAAAWRAVEALWAPAASPETPAESDAPTAAMEPVQVSWAPSATAAPTGPLETPPAEPHMGVPASPVPMVAEPTMVQATARSAAAPQPQHNPDALPAAGDRPASVATEGPQAMARERTQPAGSEDERATVPEVTVRRMADPRVLAMSRRRAGAQDMPADLPPHPLSARLAELESTHRDQVAQLQADLEAARHDVHALAARLEASQTKALRAQKALRDALEVLAAGLAD